MSAPIFSESSYKTDLIFKALSAGIIPAMMWVNALSSDVAVLKSRLEAVESTVDKMGEDLNKAAKTTHENAIKLEAITQSLNQIHTMLAETRQEIRTLNNSLLGGHGSR
jgi:phage-related tail protein